MKVDSNYIPLLFPSLWYVWTAWLFQNQSHSLSHLHQNVLLSMASSTLLNFCPGRRDLPKYKRAISNISRFCMQMPVHQHDSIDYSALYLHVYNCISLLDRPMGVKRWILVTHYNKVYSFFFSFYFYVCKHHPALGLQRLVSLPIIINTVSQILADKTPMHLVELSISMCII